MKTTRSPAQETRQRLLDAAARVFARSGLAGATTRNIAREAGVNEVTLFRHFQSKDRLLAAVVGENFGEAAIQVQPMPPRSGNLRADLMALARHYDRLLTDNLPLVRTMLGEIQHHARSQERQVYRGIFLPVKEAVLACLKEAHAAGSLRADLPPEIAADLFGSMIFTGAIRRSVPNLPLAYTADAYLDATVEVLLNGAAAAARRP